jgi:hypothetical protein
MLSTITTALKAINFPNQTTELQDFPSETTIEAYTINGIILSKELRPSPRVIEREQVTFVTYYGKHTYSYSDGEDFDLIEYSTTTNLVQAILDVTNLINQNIIQEALEYEAYKEDQAQLDW